MDEIGDMSLAAQAKVLRALAGEQDQPRGQRQGHRGQRARDRRHEQEPARGDSGRAISAKTSTTVIGGDRGARSAAARACRGTFLLLVDHFTRTIASEYGIRPQTHRRRRAGRAATDAVERQHPRTAQRHRASDHPLRRPHHGTRREGVLLTRARLRTGIRIAAGSFGSLSVRFSVRFCANMRTREQGRTSFVRVFASLPGRKDRTAAVAAGYSYLLVATDARSTSRDRLRAMPCQKEENERSEVKSTKTIRMSLSREQPPARVERAQQEQGLCSLPLRARGLSVVLVPLQARMRRFKTASRGDRRLLCFLLVPNASLPPRFAANDPGPMPKPRNEGPAKSGKKRGRFACKPANRRPFRTLDGTK